jgi:hypothetical protein
VLLRRPVLALSLAALSAAVLAGCVAAPAQTAATASAAPVASASPVVTVSTTPEAEATVSESAVVLSLDGASTSDGVELPYAIDDLDAWSTALGSEPTQTSPIDGPYGPLPELTKLEWSGLRLTVPNDGSATPGRFFVSSPSVSGHPLRTADGIGVGSTRDEALAAGAVEGFDATELRLGAREVPGTQSLSRPGEVGREWIMLVLEGDAVVSMQPGNDFSDI